MVKYRDYEDMRLKLYFTFDKDRINKNINLVSSSNKSDFEQVHKRKMRILD